MGFTSSFTRDTKKSALKKPKPVRTNLTSSGRHSASIDRRKSSIQLGSKGDGFHALKGLRGIKFPDFHRVSRDESLAADHSFHTLDRPGFTPCLDDGK